MADKKLTIQEIVDAVAELNVLELSELVKAIEDKFGVTAAAPVAVAAAAPVAAEAPAEEKSEFDVEITEAGANKIAVIKALRELDQTLGLAEAKAKVDAAPTVVASEVAKDKAEAMKKKLEEAGAKVTLK
ncbi:MAG: 50S ribosomal protein L7/L12 [Candidatus Dojkabacteria bacterium]|nr:MAG: 50S ribosomal protein L7/L12 [Candidatus Dojkabacteria bacterium]